MSTIVAVEPVTLPTTTATIVESTPEVVVPAVALDTETVAVAKEEETTTEAEAAVVESGPVVVAPVATAVVEESKVEKPVTPLKRSPFSDLKNKLFAPKVAAPVVPVEDAPAKVDATVEEPVVAPVEVVEPEVPAAVEEVAAPKVEKVRGPSVIDRVKTFFEKKEKSPKAETVAATDAAIVDTETPEAAAVVPAVEETVVPVTEVADVVPAAEVAAAEPVVEAAAEPLAEVAAVTPVVGEAATDAVVPQTEVAAVKFDEAAKSEEKEKSKIDLVKMTRRLSARVSNALSPKKEKKDPLAAVATEEAKAQEEATPAVAAEVEEVKIEEAKAGLTTIEPVTEVAAPVEEPAVEKVEEAAVVA